MKECVSGSSLPCGGQCNFHYHKACVEGMTDEFVDNCTQLNKIHGGSFFLCLICRRVIEFMNTTFKQQGEEIKEAKDETKEIKALFKDEIKELKNQIKVLTLEVKVLTEKVSKSEVKADQAVVQTNQVRESMARVEKEVETGMEQAVKEAKEDMTEEMKERDEKATNLVIYGLKESREEETEARKKDDKQMMKELAQVLEVDLEDGFEVKYRAGKKRDDGTPRPMIVKLDAEEKREQLLARAGRLARNTTWKEVFVRPDLTKRQREEANKKEAKLREEATRKTDEAKNEGKRGRYIVVGTRGSSRRVVWREEREEER